MRPKFDINEITNVKIESLYGGISNTPVFNTPISRRENFRKIFTGEKPLWLPQCIDTKWFVPKCNQDNPCRFFDAEDDQTWAVHGLTAEDMFGIPWRFVPTAMGPIEDPDFPVKLNDMSEWPEKLTWQNPADWKWEASGIANKNYLADDHFNLMWMFSGYFERLISMVGFMEAASEMIDEDCVPYIHSFFEKITDVYISEIEHSKAVFDIDGVYFHDDWGSERSPFFSTDTLREMIMPHMQRVIDKTHELGLVFQLHSCGCNERHIETMIEMGIDIWEPQGRANNVDMLYENYGDQIVLGIFTNFDLNGTDEECEEYAKRFVDKYAANFDTKKMYVADSFFVPTHPSLAKYIYKAGREAFC